MAQRALSADPYAPPGRSGGQGVVVSGSHLLPGTDVPLGPDLIVVGRLEPEAAILVHRHRPPYPSLRSALVGHAFQAHLAGVIGFDALITDRADIFHLADVSPAADREPLPCRIPLSSRPGPAWLQEEPRAPWEDRQEVPS